MYLGFEVIHVGIGCMDEALRKSRYAVTRYRKLTSYGTVVRYSVPAFRLSSDQIVCRIIGQVGRRLLERTTLFSPPMSVG